MFSVIESPLSKYTLVYVGPALCASEGSHSRGSGPTAQTQKTGSPERSEESERQHRWSSDGKCLSDAQKSWKWRRPIHATLSYLIWNG